MSTIDRSLRQYHSHTKTLTNGDKAVGLPGNVWDLFVADGWLNRIRIRFVKQKAIGGSVTRMEQLSGLQMTESLKQLVLKELV